MLFVVLLVTLHPLPGQGTTFQEPSLLSLIGGDLLACAFPSSRGGEGVQKMDLPRQKSYAVAPLRSREGQIMLQVTLWGECASEDAAAFISSLAHHPLLVVGLQRYTVQSVHLSQHPWVSLATWADLMSPSNDQRLELRFITPTMFQESPIDACPSLDFPEPAVVFSSLLRRWVSLGGPPLTDNLSSLLERHGCVVSDYRLYTRHHVLPQGMQTGWVGWVLYACRDQRPESVATLNSLARLACFTGTGCATEHGMGLTRLMYPQHRGA